MAYRCDQSNSSGIIYSTFYRPEELDSLEVLQEVSNFICTWPVIRTYVSGLKLIIELTESANNCPFYVIVENWKEKDYGHALSSFFIPVRKHHIECLMETYKELYRQQEEAGV